MSHETQALLPAFVCELLDDAELATVRAHLDGCPACASERSQLERALAELEAEVAPPPEVWDAIEEALAVEVLSEAIDLDRFDAEPGDLDPLEPLAADPDSLRRSFGPYEVLEDVSQSPRAVLYRARREGQAEVVALKVHREGPLLPRRWVERFLHEAQALVKLEHPGLATVRDVGRHQSFPFFTRDWIPGASLADWLARDTPPDPRAVLQAVAEAAEGLHAAHAHGVIHRGLRPANVIVGPRGGCVVDFALEPGGDLRQRLAADDGLPGDPRYQAPEQVRGEGVDRRTDVYGLGAVLLHALSGVAPFEADSGHELLERILTEPAARLRARALGLSPDVARVIAACLAKDPADRYASARRLAEDLHRCLRGEPLAGPDPRRAQRRRRSWRAGLALAGALCATGAGAWGVVQWLAARARGPWTSYVHYVESALERAADQLERASALADAKAGDEAVSSVHLALAQLDRCRDASPPSPDRRTESAALWARLAPREAELRAQAFDLLGRLAIAQGNLEGALDAWLEAWKLRAARGKPPAWDETEPLAESLLRAGQGERALPLLERSDGPPGREAWLRARIHRAAGQTELERGALDATIAATTPVNDRGAPLLRRSQLAWADGRPIAALHDLERHLEWTPRSRATLLARAQLQLALGRIDRAEQDLLRLREDDASQAGSRQRAWAPTSSGAQDDPDLVHLGAAVALASGQLDDARSHYDHLRRLRAQDFDAWAEYGRTLDLELDDEGALAAYARARAPGFVPGLTPDPADGALWVEAFAADPVLIQLEAEPVLARLPWPSPPARLVRDGWRAQRLARVRDALARQAHTPQATMLALSEPDASPTRVAPAERHLLSKLEAHVDDLRARAEALTRALEAESAATGARNQRVDSLLLRRLQADRARALLLEARLQMRCSQGDGAGWPAIAELLDQAEALAPGSVALHAARASLARRRGDGEAATRALERARLALEAGAGELGALYQRGRQLAACQLRGELDLLPRALRAFLRVQLLAPDQPYAALEAARLLAENGRDDLARELLDRALDAAPNLPEAWLERGHLELRAAHDLEALGAAQSAFERVLARRADVTHHAEARAGLAQVALRLGKPGEAAAQLELAWRSLPTDLGLASHAELARQREILRAHLAVASAPAAVARLARVDAACRTRRDDLHQLATQALRTYDVEAALAGLDGALELDPDQALIVRARGEAQLRSGQRLGGALDLCRAVRLDPAQLVHLEQAQRLHDLLPAGWRTQAPRWLALRPRDPDLRLALGIHALDLARGATDAQAQAGLATRAEAALSDALALAPALHAARLLRAEARALLGRDVEAAADVAAVQAAVPWLPAAREGGR